MLCNAKKTCCMIFKPRNNKFVISENFKRLSVNNFELKYVDSFKYLGHIINDKLCDDDDLNRQVRNLYVLCNILLRHYNKCSMRVKKMLYKSFCLYLYGASLWKNATCGASNYFKSCFNRCMKIFFCYRSYESVTNMLLALGLPSFETTLYNACMSFKLC